MGASACSRARVETVNSNDVEIKDGQGKGLRCISLETKRPEFLADAIPCATRSLQGSDPTQWAMTHVQLLTFFNYMRSTPEYEAAKQARGHVCLYDVNSLFVIPWSKGFGCGVALLMNAHAPLKAQVMISHAWAEDVEELVSSLSSWASRIQSLWDSDGVPLWCCTFAQYQPEDGAGPSLQHQLSLDPFKSVIHSKPEHGMLVVHTTKADPYDRLWCVHEVDEALESKLFLAAIGTYSLGGRTSVCTRSAKCGHAADEARIRAVIESKDGGYERLDRTISAFRSTLLKSGASVIAEIQVPWHLYSSASNLLELKFKVIGLDKIGSELLEFGVERKELFGLFTLTDSYGDKIPVEKIDEFDPEEVAEGGSGTCRGRLLGGPLEGSWTCMPEQPLELQQFPLKLACALDVRYRRQRSQNEIASSSYTIAKNVSHHDSYERRWNEMKLQHPVLCGQWTLRTLHGAQSRVAREIFRILDDTILNADVFRFDFRQRDFSQFGVYLKGPQGTPYDSGWFAAKFNIPVGYPWRPPKVNILTKILHPNIGAESGEVCLDNRGMVQNMDKVLLAVLVLLAEPEPQDPANVEAAALQLNHPELFAEKARLWTRMYALPKPPSFRDLGIGTVLPL